MEAYDVSALKFVKKGKVKDVYEIAEDTFLFHFTDKISVFDKVIPSLIPRKGETLQRCSAHWFKAAEMIDSGLSGMVAGAPVADPTWLKRDDTSDIASPATPRAKAASVPLEEKLMRKTGGRAA